MCILSKGKWFIVHILFRRGKELFTYVRRLFLENLQGKTYWFSAMYAFFFHKRSLRKSERPFNITEITLNRVESRRVETWQEFSSWARQRWENEWHCLPAKLVCVERGLHSVSRIECGHTSAHRMIEYSGTGLAWNEGGWRRRLRQSVVAQLRFGWEGLHIVVRFILGFIT
jgi:hypothetical protein